MGKPVIITKKEVFYLVEIVFPLVEKSSFLKNPKKNKNVT
jgi:hypothetical protein